MILTLILVAAGLRENINGRPISKTMSAAASNSVATILPGSQFVSPSTHLSKYGGMFQVK